MHVNANCNIKTLSSSYEWNEKFLSRRYHETLKRGSNHEALGLRLAHAEKWKNSLLLWKKHTKQLHSISHTHCCSFSDTTHNPVVCVLPTCLYNILLTITLFVCCLTGCLVNKSLFNWFCYSNTVSFAVLSLSSVIETTREYCTPSSRWMPEHSMQVNTPRLCDNHVGPVTRNKWMTQRERKMMCRRK